jgi:hypothetical protein
MRKSLQNLKIERGNYEALDDAELDKIIKLHNSITTSKSIYQQLIEESTAVFNDLKKKIEKDYEDTVAALHKKRDQLISESRARREEFKREWEKKRQEKKLQDKKCEEKDKKCEEKKSEAKK